MAATSGPREGGQAQSRTTPRSPHKERESVACHQEAAADFKEDDKQNSGGGDEARVAGDSQGAGGG